MNCSRSATPPAISFRLARNSVQRLAVATSFICTHPFDPLLPVTAVGLAAIGNGGKYGLSGSRGGIEHIAPVLKPDPRPPSAIDSPARHDHPPPPREMR